MEILIVGSLDIDNYDMFFDKIKEFNCETIVFTRGFFTDPKLMKKIYESVKNVFIIKHKEDLVYTANRTPNGWLAIVDKPRRFELAGKKVVFCPLSQENTFTEYDMLIGKTGINLERGMQVYDVTTGRKTYSKKCSNFDTKFKDIEWDDNNEYDYYHLSKKIGPNGEKEKNPGKNTITFYTPVVHE